MTFRHPSYSAYDQAVVPNSGAPPAFGSQSLRHLDAYNEPTGEFLYQTYSLSQNAAAAGEELAQYRVHRQVLVHLATTPAPSARTLL